MAITRWLRPSHPASGALFGYLFGYAGWVVLLVSYWIRDGRVSDEDRLLWRAAYGLLWAIPWAIIWGFSGALALEPHGYPATLVTTFGIASGTTYSLLDSTFDGWQAMTIPIYSFGHVFLYHVVALPVWCGLWEIIDWWNDRDGDQARTPC